MADTLYVLFFYHCPLVVRVLKITPVRGLVADTLYVLFFYHCPFVVRVLKIIPVRGLVADTLYVLFFYHYPLVVRVLKIIPVRGLVADTFYVLFFYHCPFVVRVLKIIPVQVGVLSNLAISPVAISYVVKGCRDCKSSSSRSTSAREVKRELSPLYSASVLRSRA